MTTVVRSAAGLAKGTSGNPAGRPAGSRNKSTLFLEGLLADKSEALVRKAIELALKGETAALRLCLERIYAPRKERLIDLDLPEITDPQQVAKATASILAAVAQGQITPGEAEILARTVQLHAQILKTEDLVRRVAELEKVIARAPRNPIGETAFEDLSDPENFDDEDLDLGTETGGDSGAGADVPKI